MLVGGSWMSEAAFLLLMALEMCSVCPTFCTVDVGGAMVKDVAFISIFCDEF